MVSTKTNDYNMFNSNPFNREINERNVLKLMRSLRAKNLLKNRPILVDKKLSVIDGQHRLEAAKRLNIPVWYEIQDDLSPEDIGRLNDNQRLWDNNDWLRFHVEKGNENYVKLKSFANEHKISLATAFVVLGYRNTSGKGKRASETDETNLFKAGKFVFPSSVEQIEAVDILKKSREIIDYCKPKLEGNTKYLEGPHFRRSLYIFLQIRAVEFDVFMDKLSQRLDLLRPCSRTSDFVSILKQIYNFRNRNPITLEEFV